MTECQQSLLARILSVEDNTSNRVSLSYTVNSIQSLEKTKIDKLGEESDSENNSLQVARLFSCVIHAIIQEVM